MDKWERRDKKLAAKKARMPVHGAGFAKRVYPALVERWERESAPPPDSRSGRR